MVVKHPLDPPPSLPLTHLHSLGTNSPPLNSLLIYDLVSSYTQPHPLFS